MVFSYCGWLRHPAPCWFSSPKSWGKSSIFKGFSLTNHPFWGYPHNYGHQIIKFVPGTAGYPNGSHSACTPWSDPWLTPRRWFWPSLSGSTGRNSALKQVTMRISTANMGIELMHIWRNEERSDRTKEKPWILALRRGNWDIPQIHHDESSFPH